MINLIGLNNIIKPAKVQNTSNNGFRYAMTGLKADSFERSNTVENQTCPISFTGKSNRLKEYKKTINNLNQTAENAQKAFDEQLASDGWAGKTADAISILWNSKNRAKLVQSDIDSYKEQVNELENSIKEDKFKDKFKEMFDVEYNHSNIEHYRKKVQQFETALTADCIAKFTEEKLSENLKTYKKLSGNLKDLNETRVNPYAATGCIPYYNHTTTKDEIFENMENSLVEILGDKKVLDKVLSSSGLDSENASKEDKYKVYGFLSEFIVNTSKASAEKCMKGKTLSEIKEDYDKSYEKAFGTKNDIISRVDKYNASQKAGAACVKFVTGVVLNALGPSSVLASFAYSAATSVAMDVADATTNNIDRDFNIKATAINAGLNGVCGAVNQSVVNKYSSEVTSKILSSIGIKSTSKNIGTALTGFVVREIISKEGVKLPAYAVEAVTKSVVQSMAGIKTSEDGSTINQKDLENAIYVVSEAMVYLTAAKNSGKLQNKTQNEIISLLKEHITTSMKDNQTFNTWLNKNEKHFEQTLNQLVNNEFLN